MRPHWTEIPTGQSLPLLDRDPPGQIPPLYGNERAVRILLECILVIYDPYGILSKCTRNAVCLFSDKSCDFVVTFL